MALIQAIKHGRFDEACILMEQGKGASSNRGEDDKSVGILFNWTWMGYYSNRDWFGRTGRRLRAIVRYGIIYTESINIEGYYLDAANDPFSMFQRATAQLLVMVAAIQHPRVGGKSSLRVLPMDMIRYMATFLSHKI